MTWVYKKDNTIEYNDKGLAERVDMFYVGYFVPALYEGNKFPYFQIVEEYGDLEHARRAVHFLNGGSGIVEVCGTVNIGTTGL